MAERPRAVEKFSRRVESVVVLSKNEECKNVNELLAVSCIFIIFPENSNAIVASIYGALSEIISMTKINEISRGKVIVMNLDLF